MLFRKRLFTILAILALGWIVLGFTSTSSYNEKRNGEVGTEVSTSSGYQAGQVVGSTFAISFFLCSGIPLFLAFNLLAWRNSVGLRHQRDQEAVERRHQEALEAMRQSH